jgi:hypothetical protein
VAIEKGGDAFANGIAEKTARARPQPGYERIALRPVLRVEIDATTQDEERRFGTKVIH